MICSADVASALAMAGVLDYAPALAGNNGLIPDDTSSTLVGTLNGRIKVYVDPYSANVADKHFYVVGYKGSNAYDAGLFYCPYVPLQMVRAINPNTFRSKIDSRLVTAWSPTHSLRVLPKAAAHSPLTPTATIVAYRLLTSCDIGSHTTKDPSGSFFMLH